jgi:nitrogen PTS system EIIA component
LLERGDLPAVKVGGQWRFRKATVDEWLDVNVQRLDADSLQALEGDEEAGQAIPRLAELIAPENARLDAPAGAQDAVIRAFVGSVTFPEPVSPDVVCERVLEREQLCSTALSGGVALLHTARTRPRVLQAHDLIAIGHVQKPVEFGALDGSVTDTLILVLGRNERHQLALLAKLTRLCQEPGFLTALREAPDAGNVIALVRNTARRLFVSTL